MSSSRTPWLSMHPVSSSSSASLSTSSSYLFTSTSVVARTVERRNKRSFDDNGHHAVYLPEGDKETRRHGVVVQDVAILVALGKLGYLHSQSEITPTQPVVRHSTAEIQTYAPPGGDCTAWGDPSWRESCCYARGDIFEGASEAMKGGSVC
jgi:hypothetical protein